MRFLYWQIMILIYTESYWEIQLKHAPFGHKIHTCCKERQKDE